MGDLDADGGQGLVLDDLSETWGTVTIDASTTMPGLTAGKRCASQRVRLWFWISLLFPSRRASLCWAWACSAQACWRGGKPDAALPPPEQPDSVIK
jgi:hypothetical protein